MTTFRSPFSLRAGDQVWVHLQAARVSESDRLSVSAAIESLAAAASPQRRAYWPGFVAVANSSFSLASAASASSTFTGEVSGAGSTTVDVVLYGLPCVQVVVDTSIPSSFVPLCWFGIHMCDGTSVRDCTSACIEMPKGGSEVFHFQPLWNNLNGDPLSPKDNDVHRKRYENVRLFLSSGEVRVVDDKRSWCGIVASLDRELARISSRIADGPTPAMPVLATEVERFGDLFVKCHLPFHRAPARLSSSAGTGGQPNALSSSSSTAPTPMTKEEKRRGILNRMYAGNEQLFSQANLAAVNKTLVGAFSDAFKGFWVHVLDRAFRFEITPQVLSSILPTDVGSATERHPFPASHNQKSLTVATPAPHLAAYSDRNQPDISDAHLKAYLAALSPEDAAAIRAALGAAPPTPPRRTRVEHPTAPPIAERPAAAMVRVPQKQPPPAPAAPVPPTLMPIPARRPSNFGRQLVPPLVPPQDELQRPTTSRSAATVTSLRREIDPWDEERLRHLRHQSFEVGRENNVDVLAPVYLFHGLLGAVSLSPNDVNVEEGGEEVTSSLYNNTMRISFKDLPSSLAYEHSHRPVARVGGDAQEEFGGRANRKILLVALSHSGTTGSGWPEPMLVTESAKMHTVVSFRAPNNESDDRDGDDAGLLAVPANWSIPANLQANTTAKTLIPLDVDAQIKHAAAIAVAERSKVAGNSSQAGGGFIAATRNWLSGRRGVGGSTFSSEGIDIDMIVSMRNVMAGMSNWSGVLALIEVDVIPISRIKEWVISRPVASGANANVVAISKTTGRKRGIKSSRQTANSGVNCGGRAEDDDDDVTVGDATVQLACPLSGLAMEVPIRGRRCQHLQCVELEHFLSSSSRSNVWRCPVCLGPLPYSDIVVDLPLLEYLRTWRQHPTQGRAGGASSSALSRDGSTNGNNVAMMAVFSSQGGGKGKYVPASATILSGGQSQGVSRAGASSGGGMGERQGSLLRAASVKLEDGGNTPSAGRPPHQSSPVTGHAASSSSLQTIVEIVDCDED